jgi:pimeloyl-ACP methyl ester carboxylesterase
MEVQFVDVDNCKIAYIEKNKEPANTIFFIPGNSVSKSCWRKQYDSPELSASRMIAFDFPAHGDSDATDEKNYTLPRLAAIMYKAVNQLSNGKPYILAGISLGTNIVSEMLAFETLPAGLILAGPCVFGENYTVDKMAIPNTHVGVVFTDEPDEKDVIAYAHETFLSRGNEDFENFINDFKKVKPPFRSALGKSIFDGNYSDEVALLKEKNIRALIVFGKDEQVIDCNYLEDASLPLWNKTIYKIDGASHLVNIDQPQEFNQLIKSYSEDIFK